MLKHAERRKRKQHVRHVRQAKDAHYSDFLDSLLHRLQTLSDIRLDIMYRYNDRNAHHDLHHIHCKDKEKKRNNNFLSEKFGVLEKKTINLQAKMIELSIIVPVYNVEKYVHTCLESIFKQELDDASFEVIIVNDGSTDRSMEMIEHIISQHRNITVINQDNKGISIARNNGIANAKGKYILMTDSDDLLIENSLKPLLEIALESQADLIVADFKSMTDNEIEQTNTSLLQLEMFNYREKTGEELFLEDLNPHHCYVWRTLYRSDFLKENNMSFVPGIYVEDMPFTHECYLKAKKCIRASWLLNIYRKRNESATFSFNKKKTKDFCIAIAKTWELTQKEGLSTNIQNKLRENVYTSFSTVIWIIVHKIEKASDRIAIIDFLKQQAPDLWFKNGTKQILESFLYRYQPHLYIFLHYIYTKIFQK